MIGAFPIEMRGADMEFVRQLGSRVTVLCEGKILADGPLEKVQADPRVIEAYLGRGAEKK
jgi:urea transport system ATP-binding protein